MDLDTKPTCDLDLKDLTLGRVSDVCLSAYVVCHPWNLTGHGILELLLRGREGQLGIIRCVDNLSSLRGGGYFCYVSPVI